MIRGEVLATGEAVVALQVRGRTGQIARVETMVDTGFNDQMTLPHWVVEKLDLEFRHEAAYTLADGVKSVTGIFAGEVEWHGNWQAVLIADMGDPLLGMVMMHGCNLDMDIVTGGSVVIRSISS